MILDTIYNIELNRNLSLDIYAGLLFLKNIDPEISLGTYTINSKAKAIVSEYETKEEFIRGYESHKHVIDIQYPVKGIESVKWSPIKGIISIFLMMRLLTELFIRILYPREHTLISVMVFLR